MRHNWIHYPKLDIDDTFHGNIIGYECTRCGKQTALYDSITAEGLYFDEDCDLETIKNVQES